MELKELFDKINTSLGYDDLGRPRQLSPIDMDRLTDFVRLDGMAVEVIYEAFAVAVEQEADKPKAYMWSVLRRWKKAGVKTLDDVEANREAFDQQKVQSRAVSQGNNIPAWSNPDYKAPAGMSVEEFLADD